MGLRFLVCGSGFGVHGLGVGFEGCEDRLELSKFALFGIAELLPPAWWWWVRQASCSVGRCEDF